MTATKRRKQRKVSGFELEKLLKNPAAIGAWSKQQIDDAKDRVLMLKGRFYGRQAFVMFDDAPSPHPPGGNVGGMCCSHAWAEDCWERKADYPPRANSTPMISCVECGAFVPSLAFEGECCADCRSISDHEAFGSSVSSQAIAAMRHFKLRFDPAEEARMLPEDAASLKREIKRAKSGQFVPE
jgi:hypothetical protein